MIPDPKIKIIKYRMQLEFVRSSIKSELGSLLSKPKHNMTNLVVLRFFYNLTFLMLWFYNLFVYIM